MRPGFEALGRLRLQAILLLAAVFVIGVICGIAFERACWRGAPPHRPGGPPPEGLPPELTRELRLTQDQEERIRGIFDSYRPRTDAILDEFFPRLRAVTDSARAEIRTLLTPAQQEIFDREQPPGFGRGGRPHHRGGPPLGGPGFGDRPPGPGRRPPPGCPSRGEGTPGPEGPGPADRDSSRELRQQEPRVR